MAVNVLHRGNGSRIDLASHGLPTAAYKDRDVLNMPKLMLGSPSEVPVFLDMVFKDGSRAACLRQGQAKYVREHYTYNAFLKNIKELLVHDYFLPDDTE